MATPAERYAAARKRSRTSPHLAAFRDRYDFPLDTFQVQACEALDDDDGGFNALNEPNRSRIWIYDTATATWSPAQAPERSTGA